MVKRFILKRINRTPNKEVKNEIVKEKNGVKNNVKKNENDMIIPEQIEKAQEMAAMINDENVVVKKVRKEKGLMEKTNSDKVVLVEDNRQILID